MVTSGLNYCQDLFLILRLEQTIQRDSRSENPAAPPAAFFHCSNKIRPNMRYLAALKSGEAILAGCKYTPAGAAYSRSACYFEGPTRHMELPRRGPKRRESRQ